MSDPKEIGKELGGIVRDAIAPLRERIAELEKREPIKGDQGEKGIQGEPGKDCEPIEIAEVVRELVKSPDIVPILSMLVAEAVTKHMAEHPPKDGKDGRDGVDGKDGEQGIQGEKGVGAAGAMIDRDGVLIMTMTNGEAVRLGNVVGKDGDAGKDGADLSDVSFDLDGRELSIKANGGEVVKRYTLPIPLDAGYWDKEKKYHAGDVVTEAGSAWIASRETSERPNYQSKDWRMLARKGKDLSKD